MPAGRWVLRGSDDPRSGHRATLRPRRPAGDMRVGCAAGRGHRTVRRPVGAARVAVAFLVRSLMIFTSYRLRALLGFVSLGTTLLGCVLVGRLVATGGAGFGERFGMSYTAFALVGVVVHGAASSGLRVFRTSVRREQLLGTLEHLLACPVDPSVLVVLSALGQLLLTLAGGLALLAVVSHLAGLGAVVSGEVLLPVVLYAASMAGLGLLSSAVVLVHKEGEPVSWALSTLTGVLGGVFVPVELLPGWVRGASLLLPTTHALALVRSALVPGHATPSASIPVLCLSAATLPVAGFIALRFAFRRARRDGSLGHY
ncbi:MAG: hypothetical protein GF405_01755 [Candidatus Eisenbacteria bacterium]|nr:hypothetical protein [Candidatus Eisenbacteria bacterium]